MALIGWIRSSPRYPAALQREKLKARGASKIYQFGEDTDDVLTVIKSIRAGDKFAVFGLHRLGANMKQLTVAMQAIAKRNRPVIDLELDIELPARNANAVAAYANAKRVFDGELRGTPAEYAERGRKGGNRAAKVKRIELTKAHRQVWMTSATNMAAAEKIADMLGKPVSFQTLRRKFGPSGRTAGWPPKVK